MDDIEREVRDWDATSKCIPTFEEFRDVEFVRRCGRVNMFFSDGVLRELADAARWDGITWIKRCQSVGRSWASIYSASLAFFEKEHGPADSWYTSELLDTWREEAIDLEQRALEERLAEIKSRRRVKQHSS